MQSNYSCVTVQRQQLLATEKGQSYSLETVGEIRALLQQAAWGSESERETGYHQYKQILPYLIHKNSSNNTQE